MMKPPTTFMKNGHVFAIILNGKEGHNLPQEVKEFCALTIARNSEKHKDAAESIIAHGLARDAAEADELLREA
jgi:hypothetical protein